MSNVYRSMVIVEEIRVVSNINRMLSHIFPLTASSSSAYYTHEFSHFTLQERSFKSKYSFEVVVHVDPYEEQEKKAKENKLILERFKAAWQPPIKILIIDLSLVSYVDTVAIKTLTSVSMEFLIIIVPVNFNVNIIHSFSMVAYKCPLQITRY